MKANSVFKKTVLLATEVTNPKEYTEAISVLKNDLKNQPACVLMLGDLGVGKTNFIHYFCESYGLKNVFSPTFSLHQRYQNHEITIDHFDLYRLTNSEEIETSGLWEILADLAIPLVFIEWSERLKKSDLPLDRKIYEIEISAEGENKRRLQLSRFFS